MKKAFEIVFQDDYIIVINKIAKILIQPIAKTDKATLTSLLAEDLGQKVFPCHRLDRETTGLVIYAKNASLQKEIMDQFRDRQVKKKYLAFIKDKTKKKKGVLEGSIIDKQGKEFGEAPKKAKTFYRILQVFDQWSLIELEPVTGRTNQLRIQLAKTGNPILGEDKYAFRRDFKVNFKRLGLHAFYLKFLHPVSRDKIELQIDLPPDMKEFLNNRS